MTTVEANNGWDALDDLGLELVRAGFAVVLKPQRSLLAEVACLLARDAGPFWAVYHAETASFVCGAADPSANPQATLDAVVASVRARHPQPA